MQKALTTFNFSKPLVWDTPDFIDQFHQLVDNSPLHSVVIHIDPVAAKKLLEVTGSRNRPLARITQQLLQGEIEAGNWELTGDTLKFSSKGKLLDGQHRLNACIQSGKTLTTHVVFGLPDSIFDILDRQRTRTPGDVLAICGVRDYIVVAGAVRWVIQLAERVSKSGAAMTPRRIQKLATGPMKDITKWTNLAAQINKAYRFPPTMLAAILYMVGKRDPIAAEGFARDMLHGNRNYTRNKNFDVLASRIISVKAQANGHLNRRVLAAMLVQTFNHWHANVTATPRALTWKKGHAFPELAFDKVAFLKAKDHQVWSDTSLKAVSQRVLHVLAEKADDAGKVALPYPKLAALSNVPERQVPSVVRVLIADKHLYLDKKGGPNQPNVYRLTLAEKRKAA